MIFVNNKPVEFTSFPDGTSSVRFFPDVLRKGDAGEMIYDIRWWYDNEAECIQLWYLVNHIRSTNEKTVITLYMPYIPNARMDRVKNSDEVFTLKWFADFINILCFDKVIVCDPHSDVSTALLNRVRVISAKNNVMSVLERIEEAGKKTLLCFPDEGAAKRYSSQIEREYVFCIKHRDWRTGKIEGLELTAPEKVSGQNILIVDDICSRGGTFTYTAEALKNAGASKIFLYISHCENTIFKGSILTDGLIEHVYTTDSIYRGHHEKITVL